MVNALSNAPITLYSNAWLEVAGNANTSITIPNPINVDVTGGQLLNNIYLNGSEPLMFVNGAISLSGPLTIQDILPVPAFYGQGYVTVSGNISGTGGLNYGGTLVININGSVFTGGETFQLFPAGSYGGTIPAIVPATPGANLVWDTSQLLVNGTLGVLASGSPPTTYLTSLTVSNAYAALLLTPAVFDPTITNYTATNSLASLPLTVTVVNVDPAATNILTVNSLYPQLLTNGITSSPLTALTGLVEGSNNVTVQTTSTDGLITTNYTVNVWLLGTNAYLSSLAVNPVPGALPGFVSTGYSYSITNIYPTNEVTVTAGLADGNATMFMSNNGVLVGPLTNSIASVTNTFSLSQPTNALTVTVLSQDLSATNTYTVNVLLVPSQQPPYLTNSVSGGANLVFNWDAAHLGYQLYMQTNNLSKGVSKVAADWAPVAGTATVTTTNLPIIKNGVTNQFYRLSYP